MDNNELKRVQDTQLDIFKEVVKICDKHNIDYFVAFGTLLGTVRHHGTIPWDNDIDIMMTRDNYIKFVQFSNELPSHLELEQSVDEHFVGEARINNLNTETYYPNHSERKGHIRIDIFIYDYKRQFERVFDHIIKAFSQFISISKLDEYEKNWLYDIHKDNKKKLFIIKVSNVLYKLFGEKKLSKFEYKLLVSSNKKTSELVSIGLFSRKTINVKDLSDYILMDYEDIKVKVPIGYDSILTNIYGNYMQLPPENERFTATMDDYVVLYL